MKSVVRIRTSGKINLWWCPLNTTAARGHGSTWGVVSKVRYQISTGSRPCCLRCTNIDFTRPTDVNLKRSKKTPPERHHPRQQQHIDSAYNSRRFLRMSWVTAELTRPIPQTRHRRNSTCTLIMMKSWSVPGVATRLENPPRQTLAAQVPVCHTNQETFVSGTHGTIFRLTVSPFWWE